MIIPYGLTKKSNKKLPEWLNLNQIRQSNTSEMRISPSRLKTIEAFKVKFGDKVPQTTVWKYFKPSSPNEYVALIDQLSKRGVEVVNPNTIVKADTSFLPSQFACQKCRKSYSRRQLTAQLVKGKATCPKCSSNLTPYRDVQVSTKGHTHRSGQNYLVEKNDRDWVPYAMIDRRIVERAAHELGKHATANGMIGAQVRFRESTRGSAPGQPQNIRSAQFFIEYDDLNPGEPRIPAKRVVVAEVSLAPNGRVILPNFFIFNDSQIPFTKEAVKYRHPQQQLRSMDTFRDFVLN